MISPRMRIAEAKSQWTNSACGSIPPLQVGDERARDRDREEDPGRGDEQRRLDDEPPEALMVWMQERQPVGLDDRPDDTAEDGDRPEQRDDPCAEARVAGACPYVCFKLCMHLAPPRVDRKTRRPEGAAGQARSGGGRDSKTTPKRCRGARSSVVLKLATGASAGRSARATRSNVASA